MSPVDYQNEPALLKVTMALDTHLDDLQICDLFVLAQKACQNNGKIPPRELTVGTGDAYTLGYLDALQDLLNRGYFNDAET